MAKFRPICVPCRREMRCKKNSFFFQAGGRIFSSDMFECESCKTQTLSGFGLDPVAEQYQHDRWEAWKPEVRMVLDLGEEETHVEDYSE